MQHVHHFYSPGETIAAVATPPGEGGIAVIRISGSDAISVADRIFSGSVASYKTHTAHYGRITDSENEVVDEVLLLVMRGPRSYTGDDTVEIHCHGGTLVTRRVLEVVHAAGARQALPGEFTFLAYMNGKLDLAQAEAVQTLIGAKNDRALKAAEDQLRGRLSLKVADFQKQLTHSAAIIEAWVDFPDEGLEFATTDELIAQFQNLEIQMQELLGTYHNGKIASDGVSLCLVGRPNVGKSSLLNALLDSDRAIVSDIPGTTRDCVEDQLRIGELSFRITDTAGIREGAEIIEEEGIRRTHRAMEQADLIAVVLDASTPPDSEELALLQRLPPERSVVIWNKSDIDSTGICTLPISRSVQVSAKQKTGLSELAQLLEKTVWEGAAPDREEVLLTNSRHQRALSDALASCRTVREGLENGISPEFLTSDVRQGLRELGKILGTDIGEDILSEIFSTFCVGK